MLLSQGLSWLRDGWNLFEASVGLIAVFLVMIFMLIMAPLGLLLETPFGCVSCLALLTIAIPTDICLIRMADAAVKQIHLDPVTLMGDALGPNADDPRGNDPTVRLQRIPFVILLASHLPAFGLIARVPMGLWWLAHIIASAAVGYFADQWSQGIFQLDNLTSEVIGLIMAYFFSFSAMVFLVLTIAVLFQSPSVTSGLWRWRFVVHAMITIPYLLRIIL